MSLPLAAAAGLVAGGAVFHEAMTRRFLAPLAASNLPTRQRWLLGLCWHFVGLTFAIIAAMFATGALGWLGAETMRAFGVLCAAIAILCGVGAVAAGLRPWRHPASYTLGVAAVLAFVGASAR